MSVRKVQFHFQDQYTIDEIKKTIENETYYLVPGADNGSKHYYQQKHRYDELDKVSQAMFSRHQVLRDTEFNHNLNGHLKNILASDLCEMFIRQAKEDTAALTHPNVINSLLPMILNKEVDSQLCSYFGSEYSLLCYNFCESDPNEVVPPYSNSWHCDGGPQKMLKILLYLNGYEEHQGNTKFMDQASSNKLKKAGFIFGDIKKRALDIGPLCREQGIEPQVTMYEDVAAGDGLLFNPTLLGHIRKKPGLASRHMLQLVFIQSPYHWQFTKDNVLPIPKGVLIGFEDVADKLLKFVDQQKRNNAQAIAVPASGNINSAAQLKMLLRNMYGDDHFADTMFDRLIALDPRLEQLNTVDSVIETLKMSFKNSINWEGELGTENIGNLAQLANFEKELQQSSNCTLTDDKPVAEAVCWPNPTDPDHPSSKYQMLPYINKQPIIDAKTIVGSAGGCFAAQIAQTLQQMDFSYLVSEINYAPDSGVVVDGYTAGDKYGLFCANYGILSNSASFRQLAERAFRVKATEKLLFGDNDGFWRDPYRQDVKFTGEKVYLAEYERHLDATRYALEQTEVFVITIADNECWAFRDGSVMSGQPSTNSYPLVKHKTLTVSENIDNIQTFFDIVKQHNPAFKLVISISPIPTKQTGHAKEQHIINANSHAKAVLKVAVEQLVQNNLDMYYLPSYELVSECIKQPYSDDERHLSNETIQQMFKLFSEIFIKA
ncbi:MAG: hypothetical protein ACI8WB_001273 [Phenylobacterium sp.]|jgi:hypothetical protein